MNLKEPGATQTATGISSPTDGISWKQPVDEQDKARRPEVSEENAGNTGAKSAIGG